MTYDPDAVLEDITAYVEGLGLELYPHQEEAVLSILAGDNVILATPTGSGKSLVAVAAHKAAMASDRVSFYTAPIKALVSEKFFALCEVFGADDVGMLTGDASVNPDAPIICCTAEVLANIALREGRHADVGLVVMDEFHFYAEPDRGWAWQVPLLELPQAQFLLMSATLGDVTELAADLTRRNGRDTTVVDDAVRPVPLSFSWQLTPLVGDARGAGDDRPGPGLRRALHPEGRRRARHVAAQRRAGPRPTRPSATQLAERLAGFRFGAGFGKTLSKLLRRGIGVHHAGMLPRYRRVVEQLAQAGLLRVISGTDTLGVGINVPIRTVLFTALAKYDGSRSRVLRSREFLQIAGRAGRAGYDTAGYVVVQAPEHTIANERAKAKSAAKNAAMSAEKQAKRGSKAQLRKPPEGTVVWTEQTYEKLVARPAGAAGVADEGRQRDADQRPRARGGRVRGDAPAAHGQPRGPAPAAAAGPAGAAAGPVAAALGHADPAGRARRVRAALRDDRRPAGRLRAQPAAGALRARGARRARPGGRGVHARHRLGHRGGAGGAAADPLPAAVRRARRGGRGDEGRRHRVRGADAAARGGHLAAAAGRDAHRDVRDLSGAAPLASRGRPVAQVDRARDVRAGDELHRLRQPLPARPVRGAGAALPDRRLPHAAPDRAGGAPHPRARRPGRVAGGDRAADRLLAARRVGGAVRPRARAHRRRVQLHRPPRAATVAARRSPSRPGPSG